MKNKIKQNKKENKNLIGKKRERNNIGFGDDEEKIKRKKDKKEKKEFNASKNLINEKIEHIKKNKNNKNKDIKDDGDDDNDLQMKDYFSKIEENLAKKP